MIKHKSLVMYNNYTKLIIILNTQRLIIGYFYNFPPKNENIVYLALKSNYRTIRKSQKSNVIRPYNIGKRYYSDMCHYHVLNWVIINHDEANKNLKYEIRKIVIQKSMMNWDE